MSGSSTFRTGEIDTRDLALSDRQEAWRRIAAPHFEVTELPADVLARGQAIHMGALTFTDSLHPEQTFTRDARMIRRDQADAVYCSVELNAGSSVYVDDDAISAQVGEIVFSDLTRPTVKRGAAGRTLCLHISRDALRAHVGDRTLLARPAGGYGSLLADYVRMIARHRAEITAATAGHFERSFLELVAASSAAPGAREVARQTIDDLILSRTTVAIDQWLAEPDLSPDVLSERLQIPRSSLYRLLETSGGVSALVRERRLLRAHELLLAGVARGSIQEVASATGFRSDSQFSRAYRRRFGETPSDTRSRMAATDDQEVVRKVET